MNELEYIKLAYRYAMNSDDPSTQNGALLVNKGIIIGIDCNRFPRNVKQNESRWRRPLKYKFIEHAERNAIYSAIREGHSTKGSVLYCPFFACPDCGRAIIETGIKKVVGHTPNGFDNYGFVLREELKDNQIDWRGECDITFEMFKEADIIFYWLSEPINDPGIKLLRGGKLMIP